MLKFTPVPDQPIRQSSMCEGQEHDDELGHCRRVRAGACGESSPGKWPYGPPGRRAELQGRTDRALGFLRAVQPITAEDRAYRILGLVWGGAPLADLDVYVKDAQSKQRADGGWSQNDTLESDVYSTSLTLYALLKAGVAPSDRSQARAISYLLGSQHGDGSWYVASRAPKFQPYFDGGFPHEHDQWISSMATGWATAALAATVKAEPPQRAAR